MPEIIELTFQPDGKTTDIKVNGCAGPSCQDLTKDIEKALGTTTSTEKTADYYKVQAGMQTVKR